MHLKWLLLLWASFVLSACPGGEPEVLFLGGHIEHSVLLEHEADFDAMQRLAAGKEVVIKGSLGKICPAGCWFYLHGEDALVYVDVEGDFKVPADARGKRATVVARTLGEGGARTLQATHVIIAP